MKWVSVLFVAIGFLIGCARGPIKSPEDAMRIAKEPPAMADDMNFALLAEGLEATAKRLKEFETPLQTLKFGPFEIPKDQYIQMLEVLAARLREDPTGVSYIHTLQSEFVALEVYGSDEWGKIFMTSYYEPMIEGSAKKTRKYSQPLYGIPEDMVIVKMREFSQRFSSLREFQEKVFEQKSRDGALRGRLVKESARDGTAFTVPTIVPYWSRDEIDSSDQPLKNRAKVLAWVDPVDAFFLQIQGSGKVKLPDGKLLRVGYAAQNGHPYVAIGQYLFDKIPREKMSQQKIEKYLRSLPAAEMQKIFNLNPSYVFFTEIEGEPRAFLGTEVVPGRTVATDQKYFPKGALAYLEYEKPSFANADEEEPLGFTKSSRFVLDQDTGGAIRGPHRLDLFWGTGRDAAQVSGVMRNPGRLYYLFPKAYLPR